MKTCTRCNILKNEIMFGKHSRNKDGLRCRCKSCEADYNKSARLLPSIKESRRLATLKYNKTIKSRECYKRYYYNNRDKLLIRIKERHKNNKDKIKLYMDKPEVRLRYRLYWSKRRALERTTSDGSINLQTTLELLVSQNYMCAICGCDLKSLPYNKTNIDHIKPLSKGGTHTLNNIQWTCQFCNFSKGAKFTA